MFSICRILCINYNLLTTERDFRETTLSYNEQTFWKGINEWSDWYDKMSNPKLLASYSGRIPKTVG